MLGLRVQCGTGGLGGLVLELEWRVVWGWGWGTWIGWRMDFIPCLAAAGGAATGAVAGGGKTLSEDLEDGYGDIW